MNEKIINSHRDLIVWQKSIDFVVMIFKITDGFPKTEIYGLVSQMRRAAVAIPSNIAEGAGRQYRKEFVQFLGIAEGSASELETQLIISKKLGFIEQDIYDTIVDNLLEIIKMLNGLSKKLKI